MLTLIPSLAAGAARPDLVLVPLHRDDCPARQIYAATPQGITHSPPVTAFLGYLDDTASRLSQRFHV